MVATTLSSQQSTIVFVGLLHISHIWETPALTEAPRCAVVEPTSSAAAARS